MPHEHSWRSTAWTISDGAIVHGMTCRDCGERDWKLETAPVVIPIHGDRALQHVAAGVLA